MDNILLLKFGDFFLGKPKKPDYYLRGISKRNLVEAATRLIPFSQPGSPYFDYENLLRRFFSKKNHPFMEEILRRVKEIEKTGQRSVAILAPQSGYTLFEEVLAIDRSKDDFSVEEIEIKIFLACLAINQGLIEKEEKLIKYQEHAEEDEKIPTLILGALLPQADYLNYNYDRLTVSQIIKALFFFDFCQRKLPEHLVKFLEDYDCKEGPDYLKKLLPIIIPLISWKKDNHVTITIPQDDSFEQKVKFLEKCAIQTPEYEANELTDFIILREQPLFKVEEGKYRIVSEVFLIEKIFKNLYFRFDAINRNLSGPNRINELHSFIALEFSEKELFYELMKLSFSNQETHFSGAQLAQMDITGAPDYLLREDGNIYLFENKDILLKAEIKNSYDFERIKKEFIKKLYRDPIKDKPKAVVQLTKSIKRILNNEIADINSSDGTLNFIYPILVLHDRVFSVEGLNFFVNKWFQLELIKLKDRGIDVSIVRPITVINIDTFALFHEQIKNCPMGFSAYLESYIDFADLDCKRGEMDVEERVERLATFDHFLPQQFEGIIRSPKILIEKGIEYLG